MKPKKQISGKNTRAVVTVDKEIDALKAAGQISAKKAIQESKAMNLDITYLEGNIIYRESPDGKKVKIAELK